jgi:DNA-binding transcriptional MerR regulator
VKEQLTLGDIAEASGLPARTIRFYIARGLLNGPVKGGRGAVYTTEHLARLDRVKDLQSEGRTLSEIAHILGGHVQEAAAAPPTAWWQHAISDDISVWVKGGLSPWRMKQVRAAIDQFARQVNDRTEEEQAIR